MEYTPRRKLTRDFKLEAVRQVALREKPKAQLARELGVRVGQLRTWRLEFEKEAVTGIAKPDRRGTPAPPSVSAALQKTLANPCGRPSSGIVVTRADPPVFAAAAIGEDLGCGAPTPKTAIRSLPPTPTSGYH